MSLTLMGEKRAGSGGVRKGEGVEYVYYDTYHYLVYDTTPTTTTRDEVLATSGLPIVGETELQSGAKCISLDAERSEIHIGYWDVTAAFETQPEDQEQNDPDPTQWTPQFSISFETKTEIVTTDAVTDDPIVNSAGEAFSEPVTRTKLICVVPFTQYEAGSQTITTIMSRNNKTNSGTFLGAAQDTLLLNVIGATRMKLGPFYVWKVNYQMKYDPDTWKLKIFNTGPNYYESGELHPCMDSDGEFKIIGNLDPDDGSQIFTDAETLEFNIYPRLDFSTVIRT